MHDEYKGMMKPKFVLSAEDREKIIKWCKQNVGQTFFAKGKEEVVQALSPLKDQYGDSKKNPKALDKLLRLHDIPYTIESKSVGLNKFHKWYGWRIRPTYGLDKEDLLTYELKEEKEMIVEKTAGVIGKKEIIESIWLDMRRNGRNIPSKDIAMIVNSFIDNVKDYSVSGNVVQIQGFITVDHIYMPERELPAGFLNPVPCVMKAHNRLRIKPSDIWKKQMRGDDEDG